MNIQIPKEEDVPVLTEQDVFRPGENVFIQTSGKHREFLGVFHKHTFIELVYVISGSATHVVGDRIFPATKGDLFIINYDTPHAFFWDENDAEPFIGYDLLFTPGFLDTSLLDSVRFESINSSFLFYSLFPGTQVGPDVHISGSSYNSFGDLFNKIYQEFTYRENGYLDLIRAYVVELIIKIFRKMSADSHSESFNRQTQIVDTTLDYLRQNYHKHLSLDDLAAQVFLSKDYFARLFRETTGMPISALLQQIRIDEACKQLVGTDTKIDDIAIDCGFNDIQYFYRIFKKVTGMTPRQYRLANAKGDDKSE